MMGWIRRASTTRLVLAAGVVLVVVVVGVVALSRRHDAVKPPPPASIGDLAALVGRRSPQGVSADVTVNGDLGAPAGTTGRVWWKPGRLRVDLGTGKSRVRLLLVGDRLTITGGGRTLAAALPFGATLDPLLSELGQSWALEPPQSVAAAGRPAYQARVVSRDTGSELGGIAVAIDADSGLPVRLTVTGADGRRAAALDLSDVRVGPVDDAVFADGAGGTPADVPAPKRIGTGLGSVLVWRDAELPLPESVWDGAQPLPGTAGGEALVTPAGTVVRFTRGGHSYVAAGLVTPDRVAAAAGAV